MRAGFEGNIHMSTVLNAAFMGILLPTWCMVHYNYCVFTYSCYVTFTIYLKKKKKTKNISTILMFPCH